LLKFVSSNWFAAKSVKQMAVEQSQFEQFTPTRGAHFFDRLNVSLQVILSKLMVVCQWIQLVLSINRQTSCNFIDIFEFKGFRCFYVIIYAAIIIITNYRISKFLIFI
jgi:hypothetical protein